MQWFKQGLRNPGDLASSPSSVTYWSSDGLYARALRDVVLGFLGLKLWGGSGQGQTRSRFFLFLQDTIMPRYGICLQEAGVTPRVLALAWVCHSVAL